MKDPKNITMNAESSFRKRIDSISTMAGWVDAFTAHLESLGDGFNNQRLKAEVVDSAKQLVSEQKIATEQARGLFRSDAAKGAAEQAEVTARHNAENQQAVVQRVSGFDLDAYRDLMCRWRSLRTQLLSSGWNLADEVHFTRLASGMLRAHQGKDVLTFTMQEGELCLHFMQWVGDNSTRIDPLAYVKHVLSQQGIDADNFDERCGGTGIANPWRPSLLSTPTTPKILVP